MNRNLHVHVVTILACLFKTNSLAIIQSPVRVSKSGQHTRRQLRRSQAFFDARVGVRKFLSPAHDKHARRRGVQSWRSEAFFDATLTINAQVTVFTEPYENGFRELTTSHSISPTSYCTPSGDCGPLTCLLATLGLTGIAIYRYMYGPTLMSVAMSVYLSFLGESILNR